MPTNANCTLGTLINESRKPVAPQFLPPKTFNPDVDTVSAFLEDYEHKAIINNWDQNLKLCYLAQYLGGQAQTWFRLYAQRNPQAEWTDTVEELKKEFLYNADVSAAKIELRYKRQKPGENVINYLRDVLRLCDMVDPKMPLDLLGEHFEQGLLPTYAYQLKIRQPASFEEVQTIMRIIHEAESEIKNTTDVLAKMSLNSTSDAQGRSSDSQNIKLDEICKIVREEVRNAMGTTPQNTRQLRTRTNDSRPVCYQCGRPGHMARACYSNQRGQSRPYQQDPDRRRHRFRYYVEGVIWIAVHWVSLWIPV